MGDNISALWVPVDRSPKFTVLRQQTFAWKDISQFNVSLTKQNNVQWTNKSCMIHAKWQEICRHFSFIQFCHFFYGCGRNFIRIRQVSTIHFCKSSAAVLSCFIHVSKQKNKYLTKIYSYFNTIHLHSNSYFNTIHYIPILRLLFAISIYFIFSIPIYFDFNSTVIREYEIYKRPNFV